MSYIAERRQEEKDRRRGEILDAAEALYRELGWDAVTMDSVAKRARLSRALVYVYFKDKRDLHFGITQRAMELLRTRFEEASARHQYGLEKVEAMGRAYMAYAQEFPHYFDACARLDLQTSAPDGLPSTPQETASMEAGMRVHEVVMEALRTGQRDGTIRKDIDHAITARALWGFTHGLIQIAVSKGAALAHQGVSVPELNEHAMKLIGDMLKAPQVQ